MARPKKQTVDYFPHFVSDGKTKLILQNEFNNDGYAFWYKLLELLCESDNQVYDYNNPASWRLLLAKTQVSEDIAVRILQLLADLEAIDSALHKTKIIWCQKLVENLELVYKRRATGMPEKPVIVNNNPVNVNKNTQTKLNNTKPYNDSKNPVNVDKNPETAPSIIKRGEFNNVLLTDKEYQKLKEKFGDSGADERIENLSRGIASKGYRYKSHYATILNWDRRESKGQGSPKSGGRLSAWDLEESKNV